MNVQQSGDAVPSVRPNSNVQRGGDGVSNVRPSSNVSVLVIIDVFVIV